MSLSIDRKQITDTKVFDELEFTPNETAYGPAAFSVYAFLIEKNVIYFRNIRYHYCIPCLYNITPSCQSGGIPENRFWYFWYQCNMLKISMCPRHLPGCLPGSRKI